MKKLRGIAAVSALLIAAASISGCGGGSKSGDASVGATLIGNAQATDSTSTAAAAEGTPVYAKVEVNVRKQPDTSAEILGVLQAGESVTRTAAGSAWWQVSYNGQTGYVAAEFMTENQGETGQPVSAPAAESEAAVSEAGTDSAVSTTSEIIERSTDYTPYMSWDLSSLSTDAVPFGYAAEYDERNVPTGANYYEHLWGQFNVDYIGDTSQNVIYLTMDEGYANTNTESILATLKEKNVKAVFFVTWDFVTGRPDLVQQMIDEGHIIGNHTVSHKKMDTLSIEEQTKEVMDLQNYVKENFNYEMKLFRYPQGEFSEQSLGLVNNLGFKACFWSYAYNDFSDEEMPVEEALPKALNAVHPGAIYLLHARSNTNTAMLGDFIDGCRERGFEFGEYDLRSN